MKNHHRIIFWISVLLVAILAASAIALRETPLAVRASPAASPSNHLFQISLPADPEIGRYMPRAAYNGADDEYLVVWYNIWAPDFRDIYARRVNGLGDLKAQFTVATGAGGDGKNRFNPDVAYNPYLVEYMVVYMVDALNDGVHYEVWGRRVAADGSWLGPEFQIFAWAHRAFSRPRIAFTPERKYLVVASALDTTTDKWNDVAGRLINEDGSTPLAGHSISAQNQTLEPHSADLAYNWITRTFLVIWRQYYSGEDWDIFGARVNDVTGNVIDPPGIIPMDRAAANQDNPAIGSDHDTRYLIVWEQALTSWDIYGREYDQFGDPVGDRFPIANTEGYEERPAVDMDIFGRYTAWINYPSGGHHQVLQFSWNPFDEFIFWLPGLVADPANASTPKVILGDEGNYLVVYASPEYFPVHIHGKLYWNDLIYLPLVKR